MNVFVITCKLIRTCDSFIQAEICTVKEQLLSEFLPDDVCPLGAQMFESPSKIYELDARQSVCQDEVMTLHQLIIHIFWTSIPLLLISLRTHILLPFCSDYAALHTR